MYCITVSFHRSRDKTSMAKCHCPKTPMRKKLAPNPNLIKNQTHKSVTFHTLAFCPWHSHWIPEKWYEIIILVLMDSMCIVMDSCLAVEIRVKKLPEHTEHSISQRKTRSYTKDLIKKFMTIIIIIGLFSSVLRYSLLSLISLCCKCYVDNWLIKRMQYTTYLPAS